MIHDWEISGFLETFDGRLRLNGVDAVALAREHGTPLFVFSEPRIRHNIVRLKSSADHIGCPLKLCYAAKAMSTMGILRAVRDAGCDIEVNSGGELWKALRAGFKGEQIIFNGTSKEVWELEMAIENGIYAVQVDSLFELSLIEHTAQRMNKKASVSLRLVPEIGSNTHSGLQTALLTSKFGMMPDEAYAAFARYKDSEHLALDGIHLHIGSQNPDPAGYTEAFGEMFESLLRIFSETGVRLRHINLGGGFPVNYLRDRSHAGEFPGAQREMFAAEFEPAQAIAAAWTAVRERAQNENALDLLEGITLLLEPGRSIIADAGICLTTVRNRKTRPVSEKAPATKNASFDTWLLTDAGFNILLSMETYKWYYHIVSAERAVEPHTTAYKLAGPLCDGGDVYFDIEGQGRLPDHRLLPENVQPGEVLALLNCGAYSLAQASQYNGRFLPAVILITARGQVEVIRRRDSFDDLVANEPAG
jgi:D-ornithine/D-lysine decarboxylase